MKDSPDSVKYSNLYHRSVGSVCDPVVRRRTTLGGAMSAGRNYLCAVRVDHDVVRSNGELEREQSIAIADLLEANHFEMVGRESGPYRLTLSTRGSRLSLHVATSDGLPIVLHILSFTPFRRVIKDYVMICEAHLQAAAVDPYRIETIDMGRRAIHNMGSELLRERLSSRIRTDLETARRLFTLIVAPYVVGGLAGARLR